MLDRLERSDRPPELLPDLRVLDGHVQDPAGAAESLGGEGDRGPVEHGRDGRPGAGRRPQQRRRRRRERDPGLLAGLVHRGQRLARQPVGVRATAKTASPLSVRAITSSRSATAPSRTNDLCPSIRQAPSRLVARAADVLGPPGTGVLGQRHRGDRRAAGDARQERPCAPLRRRAPGAARADMTHEAKNGETVRARPISSSTSPSSRKLKPLPPYSSGIAMPCRPSPLAIRSHSSRS